MALSQQQLRMMAALLAKKQQPSNALYREPPKGLLNALNKPLPMEGRFGLLPIKESQPGMGPSVFNKRELALPGLLAGAVNAFTAPGRAASGQPGFNPEEEGANFAANLTGGGLLGSRIRPPPRGSIGMGVSDYAGGHRPPMRNGGAPGHDLTGGGQVYPDDVYSVNGPRYYGHFGNSDPLDRQTFALVNKMKGNPDATVTIYRAVPKNAEASAINRGDWVTINKNYAKQHGESTLEGDYKIIEHKVRARDIFTNGDSIHEWGYDPE
jgi:hypothetical protein